MPSYSGVWTLVSQMQAESAGNWPKPPLVQELYSWGTNSSGQLGLIDTINRSSPVQVDSLTTWAKVGNFTTSSVGAIKTDGTMWTWGYNSFGELGLNNTISRSSPVQVGALTNWALIDTGAASLAIKTDGTLWSWGSSDNSQGQGVLANRSSPTQVGALTGWSKISGGNSSVLSIKTDGSLWAWGFNGSGTLGLNDTTNRGSPVQVGTLTEWSKVQTDYSASFAIKTNGTLWAWGKNQFGQLGLGDTVNRSSPVQVGALTTWLQVSTASTSTSFTLAVKTDGTLWSWGRGSYGVLGLNSQTYHSSPVQVGALTSWAFVNASNGALAVKADGTLWGWGRNNAGTLGLNNTTNFSSPVQVGADANWVAVAGKRNSITALVEA